MDIFRKILKFISQGTKISLLCFILLMKLTPLHCKQVLSNCRCERGDTMTINYSKVVMIHVCTYLFPQQQSVSSQAPGGPLSLPGDPVSQTVCHGVWPADLKAACFYYSQVSCLQAILAAQTLVPRDAGRQVERVYFILILQEEVWGRTSPKILLCLPSMTFLFYLHNATCSPWHTLPGLCHVTPQTDNTPKGATNWAWFLPWCNPWMVVLSRIMPPPANCKFLIFTACNIYNLFIIIIIIIIIITHIEAVTI